MAQYTPIISISVNDNDGGLTHAVNPSNIDDIARLYNKHGKWRTRFILIRLFWLGLRRVEKLYLNTEQSKNIIGDKHEDGN